MTFMGLEARKDLPKVSFVSMELPRAVPYKVLAVLESRVRPSEFVWSLHNGNYAEIV